ncbi:hypothetical protein R0J87_18385, partial [Halomonas sp. SIMBA_159]
MVLGGGILPFNLGPGVASPKVDALALDSTGSTAAGTGDFVGIVNATAFDSQASEVLFPIVVDALALDSTGSTAAGTGGGFSP